MKKTKPFSNLIYLGALLIILSVGVFAWIYGDSVPSISADMTVGSSNNLIIDLDSQSTNSLCSVNNNAVSISLLGNAIALNEASSVDAETIYVRDYSKYYTISSGGIETEQMSFNTAVANANAGNADYIDASFTITLNCSNTDENEYYLYLANGAVNGIVYRSGFNDGTDITDDSLKAMRAALKLEGLNAANYGTDFSATSYTILANESSETQSVNDYYAYNTPQAIQNLTSTLVDSSANIYADTICDENGNLYANALADVSVKAFSEYTLGDGTRNISLSGTTLPTYDGSSNTSPVKYIAKLNSESKTVTLNFRIWLEGQSSYCESGIINSGDTEELGLYFVAFKLPPEDE